MADVAELGVRVTNTGVAESAAGLDKLSASAGNVEQATTRLIGTSDGLTASQRALVEQGISLDQVLKAIGGTSQQVAPSMQQITDATRQMTLTQMQAIEMNDALNGKFIESRAMVLQHAAALEMDTAALTENAAVSQTAAVASGVHGLQLGRVNMELGTAIGRFTGINTAATRFTAMLGGATIGYGIMIGISLAVVAVAKAYEALTESTRKAQEAQDKATESLRKWYETKQKGEAGERSAGVSATVALIAQQQAEVDKLSSTQNAGGFIGGGVNATRIKELKALIAEEQREVAAGRADIDKTWQESFMRERDSQASALAERIKFNTKDAAARQQALALLKQDQALYAQYLQLPISDENTARIAEMAKQITTLTDALNPKASTASAKKQDAEYTRALADEIDRLAKSVKGLGVEYEAFDDANDKFSVAILKQLNIAKATEIKPAKLPPDPGIAKMLADAKAAQQTIDTMLKDMQRSVTGFFDDVFTKGISSFTSLFTDIKNLFLKMIAEMLAADVMKKIGGTVTSVLAGMIGTASTAGAQTSGGSAIPDAALGLHPSTLATAGKLLGAAGAGFGIGSMIGSLGQSAGVGETGSVLGGAAGGAAAGFAIGGPWGALAGGIAGAAGALLGFGHSASEAAKALLAYKTGQDSTNATLASWRAQITGTAADQKAAALFNLQVQYDQIQQTIQQTESGKKHEAERNKQLAEAASLYDTQKKAITDNTAAMLQSTGVLNLVSGYKLPEQNFNYAPPSTPAPPTPPGGSGTTPSGPAGDPNGDGTAFNIVTHVVLDGKVVATNVVKNLRKVSQAHFGNTDQVADAMAFL